MSNKLAVQMCIFITVLCSASTLIQTTRTLTEREGSLQMTSIGNSNEMVMSQFASIVTSVTVAPQHSQ
jgi:hypothetical protein